MISNLLSAQSGSPPWARSWWSPSSASLPWRPCLCWGADTGRPLYRWDQVEKGELITEGRVKLLQDGGVMICWWYFCGNRRSLMAYCAVFANRITPRVYFKDCGGQSKPLMCANCGHQLSSVTGNFVRLSFFQRNTMFDIVCSYSNFGVD